MSITVPDLMNLCTKTTEVITRIPSDRIAPEKAKEIEVRIQKAYSSLEKNKDRLWLQRTHRGRMLVNLIQEALTKMLAVTSDIDKEERPKVIQQLAEELYDSLNQLESQIDTIEYEAEKREIQYT